MISYSKPRIRYFGSGSAGRAAWMMPGLIAAALLWNAATPAPALAARGDIPDIRENLFGNQNELVRRAQDSLQRMKFYRGPIDGQISKALTNAVKIYQRAIGREATGRITKDLVDNMGARDLHAASFPGAPCSFRPVRR